MGDCGCEAGEANTNAERGVLQIALALNATMFAVGLVAGLMAQSSGLVADSLDMLADATAYAIALAAVHRDERFKARAAGLSGAILLLLGLGVLADVARRGLLGSSPEGPIMMAVATVSLIVNASVLRMLGRVRKGGVHLNATWIFTRVDVIANVGVIISGAAVWLTGFRFVDLIVGVAIGGYVIKEALEILGEAREAAKEALATGL
jgi:Co/Zn/Cd efflux system component